MNRQVNRPGQQNPQQENQVPQNNQQNAQNNQNTKPQQKKQKKKKRQTALRPEHFEKAKGLKKLYELTNQIKWDDPMTTQSAMNLVVMTLKTWQYQLMPKYSYQYFWKRCQALGSDKLVSAYMSKVRRIHKGQDRWDQPEQNKDPNVAKDGERGDKKAQKQQSDNEGLQLNNPLLNDQNYDNYDDEQDQMRKFRQRAQIAKKLAGNQMIDEKKQKKDVRSINDEVDELMDQDLRMFQQMNRQRQLKNKNNKKQAYEDQDEDQGIDIAPDSEIADIDNYYDD